ncbi:hypothetical protein M3Y98_00334800 [Aphelenchoides besseyi]|nr:hypothetical protein M3Y98_00334800 [Aphelenchoides besseyi]
MLLCLPIDSAISDIDENFDGFNELFGGDDVGSEFNVEPNIPAGQDMFCRFIIIIMDLVVKISQAHDVVRSRTGLFVCVIVGETQDRATIQIKAWREMATIMSRECRVRHKFSIDFLCAENVSKHFNESSFELVASARSQFGDHRLMFEESAPPTHIALDDISN